MTQQPSRQFTLGIDWEDFGQLLCRDKCGQITPPSDAIDRQTKIILDMFDEAGKKATFFILGMLAQARPDLVREIAKRGHEIALHGQRHVDMRRLDRQAAADEVREAWKTVTDITGSPLYGFRAPYFSLDRSNLYLLEVLAEAGLVYDSSIVPLKLRRYGISDFGRGDAVYQLPNGLHIVELPLTLAEVAGKLVPVAGGGYLRLFPGPVVKKVFRRLHEMSSDVNMYVHPYEFDTRPLDCRSNYPAGTSYSRLGAVLLNMKWNLFRQSVRRKLRQLLHTYEFITCRERAEYVKGQSHGAAVLG